MNDAEGGVENLEFFRYGMAIPFLHLFVVIVKKKVNSGKETVEGFIVWNTFLDLLIATGVTVSMKNL